MNSKERVIKALKFEYPDRVPRDIWVLPAAVAVNGMGSLDLIHKTFPRDLHHEWNYLNGETYTEGVHQDEWGVKWTSIVNGYTGQVKEALIKDWDDLKKLRIPIEAIDGAIDRVKNQQNTPDTFNMAFVGTLFERAQFLRGIENLYMDIYYREKGFFKLLDVIHEYNLEMIKKLCATSLDGIFMADDWGSQRSLLINPEDWISIFKPYYKQYVKLAHERGKYFFFHSDGYIMDIYKHLIDIEVDAVNSQLFCMDIEEIGKRYKGDIVFWGEISRQYILNNPDRDIVKDAVRKVKRHLFGDKGGVIAQCSYEGDGLPENIMTLYEEWLL